jgi:iron(II)-dependent oxidoreductase
LNSFLLVLVVLAMAAGIFVLAHATDDSRPTPTFTSTPSPVLSPEQTAHEQLALTPVTRNADWSPVERDFNDVTMVLVPVGCFDMGNDPEGYYWDGNEWVKGIPAGGRQCFDAPFWIDKYEVTQAQFARFGGQKANTNGFTDENRPVENITWFEARDFCEQRSARLPTEAEWEYAARGPDNWIYPWGNKWYPDRVVWNRRDSQGTADVGSILEGASWVGALDMSGNVWEWTSSLDENYPYNASDGREGDAGNRAVILRVLRGGS